MTAEAADRETVEPARLRMAELVRRTGVPKSTILFYVNEGLLPEPVRPKPNVALYDEACVDVVRYIRAAQDIHRYPISIIKSNIKHILAGASPDEYLSMGYRTFGKAAQFYPIDTVVAEDGVSREYIKKLTDLGLVYPADEDTVDEYDRRLIVLLSDVDKLGIPSDAFVPLADAIRQVDAARYQVVSQYFAEQHSPSLAAAVSELSSTMMSYLLRRLMEQRR